MYFCHRGACIGKKTYSKYSEPSEISGILWTFWQNLLSIDKGADYCTGEERHNCCIQGDSQCRSRWRNSLSLASTYWQWMSDWVWKPRKQLQCMPQHEHCLGASYENPDEQPSLSLSSSDHQPLFLNHSGGWEWEWQGTGEGAWGWAAEGSY